MDGDVAGTGAPCLPAAIRHALMIMSHLLPGRRAGSAALSSKKKKNPGSTTQISFSRPSPETPVDRLCRNPFSQPFFTLHLPSPRVTPKVPFRPLPGPSSPSACIHLVSTLAPRHSFASMCTCNLYSQAPVGWAPLFHSHAHFFLQIVMTKTSYATLC